LHENYIKTKTKKDLVIKNSTACCMKNAGAFQRCPKIRRSCCCY